MARVVILGAGFAGLTAATHLRSRLPREHSVTVVEAKDHFVMGLAKLWAMDGRRGLDAGRRPLEGLERQGIERVEGRIQGVDTAGRKVLLEGRTVPYDHLIVALGADTAPQALPGFGAAHDLYSEQGATGLAEQLAGFRGGRVLVSISSLPFKCPPAPYEAALLIEAMLRRAGVRDRTTVELTTPEPHPLPVAPPEYGARLIGLLKAKGIEYYPAHKPVRVHADSKEVEYESGARRRYDVLAGVPPHRAPEALRSSGLVDETGWVPVDASTFRTSRPDVYAVGDCCMVKLANGKPLPKAGILAEGQALVVAANLAARLTGKPTQASFDGRGYCFLEVGDGQAMEAHGEFYAKPQPTFRFTEPSSESLRNKQRFESERLAKWFGS